MEDNKRIRRSKEEIVAEIDAKIAYHKERISSLEEKKERTLNPKTRKKVLTIKKVIDFAKSEGMTPEELARKLGLEIENN